jgi:hypothetical protein
MFVHLVYHNVPKYWREKSLLTSPCADFCQNVVPCPTLLVGGSKFVTMVNVKLLDYIYRREEGLILTKNSLKVPRAPPTKKLLNGLL